MRIAIASDHAGFDLKQEMAKLLKDLGLEALDLGTHSTAPVDYPDYSEAAALAVRDGRAERAILICGSGVGASVAANKIPGIRAAVCHDHYSAHQGVEHDDMNILVLGARVVGVETARELARAFLAARFSGEPRHVRRLGKVSTLEGKYCKQLDPPAA
jgi:RpiB/LacA/LacB family sugar-phosphate isomerase